MVRIAEIKYNVNMENPMQRIPTAGLLRLAYNLLSVRIFSAIAAAGYSDLRPSHGNVMEQLTLEDGRRLTDLANFAGITAQSMSELVDDLERMEYVERRPDPTDRRAKRIHLTAKGRDNVQVGAAAAWEADEYVLSLVGEQRHHELRDILERIIADDGAVGHSESSGG
jgi:DNA-binding MarR family transcriptional regulator